MLRLVADENFNGDIVRGVLLRESDVDIVRLQDLELMGASDAELLTWAAQNNRIILTHDRATMPREAYSRIEAGERMVGVFVVNDRTAVGVVIEEILLLDQCTEQDEWNDRVAYLPL